MVLPFYRKNVNNLYNKLIDDNIFIMVISEKQFAINVLKDNVSIFKGMRVGIYGSGAYASAILEGIPDLCVECVIDDNIACQQRFGHFVIGINDAVVLGIDTIIIAASIIPTKIVFDRIKEICVKNNIRIYSVYAKDLLKIHSDAVRSRLNTSKFSDVFFNNLLDSHEVVAFSFLGGLFEIPFLDSNDLLISIENKFKVINPKFDNFGKKFSLMRNEKNNSLDSILTSLFGSSETEKQCVIQFIKDVIKPRFDSLNLLKYAIDHGKKTYVVCDSVLINNEICESLLSEFSGKLNYIGLCSVTKRSGLYRELILTNNNVPYDKIIYFGSDDFDDVIIPLEYGIHCQILLPPKEISIFYENRRISDKFFENSDNRFYAERFLYGVYSDFIPNSVKSNKLKNETCCKDFYNRVVIFEANDSDVNNFKKPVLFDELPCYSDINQYQKLSFKTYNKPKVSIVIPVYNQFSYTYNCLKSILINSGSSISYEVIIADDCSTDYVKNIEKVVSGILVIHNEKNLRFLLNCNNAASKAKGEYILFLNNDTQVMNNWLEPLVELIEKDKNIGMVGSKLIYPDGSLQEAGGILWKDGSAWNYGHGKDPSLAEFNYVKETDYISGASVMIKSSLWKEIGGFDKQFAPAYYEDTDLAFEVRKHGYKVMYQPLSVVVHFEGKSNGTDVSSGQKAYQIINNKKFFDKWKNVLEREHEENAHDVFHARDKSFGKKTILVIDHYVPTFDRDCGSRWTFQLLNLFIKKGLNVKFIGDNFAVMEPYSTILKQMGIEVLDGPWYVQNWKQWVIENNREIDFVFFERPHITINYIDFIKNNTNSKLLYLGHDLHFLRTEREFEITKDQSLLQTSNEWKDKELYIMRNVSCSYYPSSVEIEIIKKECSSVMAKMLPVQVFEKSEIDLEQDYDFINRKDILFVGGFGHKPNVDAVLWFVKDILPKLSESLNLRFIIVGSNPPQEVRNLDCENVIVKGFVSDEELKSLYDSCRMVVAPLRFGAGVKGKVIEAMKNGTPMITTDVGAEGVDGIESVIKIANSEKEFIDSIESLYNNEKLLKKLSFDSRQFVLKKFSSDSVWNILNEDLNIKD